MNTEHYQIGFTDEEYINSLSNDCEVYDIKRAMTDAIPPEEKADIAIEDHKRRVDVNASNTKFYQNLSKGRNMERQKSDMLDRSIIESNNTVHGWHNGMHGNAPGNTRFRNEKCDPDVFHMTDYKSAPTNSFGTKKYFHSLHDYLHKN